MAAMRRGGGDRWVQAILALVVAGGFAAGALSEEGSPPGRILMGVIAVAALFVACWQAFFEPDSESATPTVEILPLPPAPPVVQALDALAAERGQPVTDSLRIAPSRIVLRHAEASPTDAERMAAGAWLSFRRFLAWGAAALLVFAAGMALLAGEWRFPVAALLLAVFFAWTGWKGAGHSRSPMDDAQVHARRKRRYGWRL